jgi:hypothetical protein
MVSWKLGGGDQKLHACIEIQVLLLTSCVTLSKVPSPLDLTFLISDMGKTIAAQVVRAACQKLGTQWA